MRLGLIASTAMLTVSCSSTVCSTLVPGRNIDFAGWERATRAEVGTHNGPRMRVDDPGALRRIVEIARAQSGPWKVPWYGVPVGRLNVDIYEGDVFLGHLGVGDEFLETQWGDGFYCHELEVADRERILDLVGNPRRSE